MRDHLPAAAAGRGTVPLTGAARHVHLRVTGRALLHTLCDSDPGRFRGMRARFSRPTYPGDLLTVSMWIEDRSARFRTVSQRGEIVIDQGDFRFA